MSDNASVLIADDEEVFLMSTADLLRGRGLEVETAQCAEEAIELLNRRSFDVLISDIRMPGNQNLEFIRKLPEVAPGIQAILITGYPTLKTALASHKLQIITYLVKPVDFEELQGWVHTGVQRRRTHRAVSRAEEHLRNWREELGQIEQTFSQSSGPEPVDVNQFVNLTLGNILMSLLDLKNLTESLSGGERSQSACHLLGCPRPDALGEALREAIEVLEKTKHSFKSRELMLLRRKLQEVLDQSELQAIS
jgi:YesN/AraC family two-component response regulator